MYETLCVLLCVLAVFGGYIALRLAAFAVLRRVVRRADGCHFSCGDCRERDRCPEKRTESADLTPETKSNDEKD